MVGERIVGQQTKRAGVVLQKFPDEVNSPGIRLRHGHRRKPDLPVEPMVIWADNTGPAHRVARLALEFVFLPLRSLADDRVLGAFKNDFMAFAADAPERAVGVDQVQRVERGVHDLFW